MSYGNRERNNAYFSIMGGKITQKVKSNTPDAVNRTNKKGEEIWELKFDFIEGFLHAIEKKETDFGVVWELTIKDVDETYNLSIPYGGRIANGFLYCIQNANLMEPISFEPWVGKNQKTGEDITMLSLKQKRNGKNENLGRLYTKDNRNGLPEYGVRMDKGKQVPDSSEHDLWLEENVVKGWLIKELQKIHQVSIPVESSEDIDSPDLPF